MKKSFTFSVVLLLIALSSIAFSLDPQLLWKIEGKVAIPSTYTISDDGNTLYIQYNIRKGASITHNIYIWDIPGNKLIDSILTTTEFDDMVVSNDQTFLVCSNVLSNGTSVFDIATRKFLRVDIANSDNIEYPGIFNIGKLADESSYAVFEYSYKKVQVFNFETGKKIRDINCEGAYNFRVSFSDDGKFVCSFNDKDTTINIYSLTNSSLIKKIKVLSTIDHVSFAKSKPYIIVNYAINSITNKIQIYDFSQGKLIDEFDTQSNTNYSIFLDDDETIITGFLQSSYLQVNNIKTGSISVFEGNYRGQHLKNYGLGNKFSLVKYEGDFEIINYHDSTTIFKIDNKSNDNHLQCRTAKITPDGKYIFTADLSNGTMFIRDLLTGSVIKRFDIETSAISLDFTSDSKLLMTDDEKSNIKLWNIEDVNNPIFVKNFQLSDSKNAAISGDGSRIISGGISNVLNLIDVESGSITQIDTTLSDIRTPIFSSDKQKIVFCTKWNLIVMEYDNEKQTYVRKATIQADSSINPYSAGIDQATISNDRKFITVAASDYYARVYSFENYNYIKSFITKKVQYKLCINKAVIFENNNFIMVADDVPGIKIYDFKSGNLLWSESFNIQGCSLAAADISLDDKYLFTSINDGTLVLYNLKYTDGINDDINTNGIEVIISPNPATDYIEIQPSEGLKPSEGSDLQIFDMLGVNVFNSKGNPTPTLPEGEGVRIDVSFLTPGIYFIKIGHRVGKFVKI